MDLDELRRLSAREELSLNFIAKDEMISRALSALQGFDDIILKGGTAIHRAYLRNRRFSEDIDVDLVFRGSVREALARTAEIAGSLKGFTVAKPRIMGGTIRYDLFYMNPLEHRDRIMLEFRVVERASGYSKRIVNFGFVPADSALLNVYDVEELIRQKVECILSRSEGKDFFDLHCLLGLPHSPAAALRGNREEILKRLSLDGKRVRAIANTINHYLPRGSRPDWASFLEGLRERVRAY